MNISIHTIFVIKDGTLRLRVLLEYIVGWMQVSISTDLCKRYSSKALNIKTTFRKGYLVNRENLIVNKVGKFFQHICFSDLKITIGN